MDNKRKNWKLETLLNHPKRSHLKSGNEPTLNPIYQTAKFIITDKHPYTDQYIYTRVGNPTLRQLENTLAEIQAKEDSIVFSSGIAAITGTMLSLLKQEDHLIFFRETYKPARTFFRDFLPKFGITSSMLKLNDLSTLEKAIIPGKTKLIHFESPSNPNLTIADVEKIVAVAKKYNILVCMDGTFAGLHQHTEYAIDIVIQSLTKFGSGHGDVLAGSVSASKKIINEIRSTSILLGATLDPHAAFLVERGLKTYLLRFQKQTETANKVALFLEGHPKIKKVFYPGLKSHEGHVLAQKQMKDMGAIVSFVLDSSVNKTAAEFCHSLGLIQFAVSLGSTESLICPTLLFFGEDLSIDDRKEMGIDQFSIRLSVGLESADDLIEDLQASLA